MSWNIQTPGDYINGPLTVTGSATITGDLTVATNRLIVNSVGVSTGGSPAGNFGFSTFGKTGGFFANKNAANQYLAFQMKNSTQDYAMFIDQDGVGSNSWSIFDNTNAQTAMRYYPGSGGSWIHYINGSTAMTLNSTGLGVGVVPSAGKLEVDVGAGGFSYFRSTTYSNFSITGRSGGAGAGGSQLFLTTTGSRNWLLGQRTDTAYGASNSFFIRDDTAAATRLEIDSSGNVGIGVTPSEKLDINGNARVQLAYFTGGTIPGLANPNPWAYRVPGGGLGLGAATETGTTSPIIMYTGQGGVERVRVKGAGQVRFFPLAADPAGAEAGDVYYNSVSNRLKYYNGTAWTLI